MFNVSKIKFQIVWLFQWLMALFQCYTMCVDILYCCMHRKYNGSTFLSKLNNFAKRHFNLGQIGKMTCLPATNKGRGRKREGVACICVLYTPDACIVYVLFICRWNNFVHCLFCNIDTIAHMCVLSKGTKAIHSMDYRSLSYRDANEYTK